MPIKVVMNVKRQPLINPSVNEKNIVTSKKIESSVLDSKKRFNINVKKVLKQIDGVILIVTTILVYVLSLLYGLPSMFVSTTFI